MLSLVRKLVRPFDVNSSRRHLERFVVEAASSAGDGDRVLDAGAGDCRYGRFFGHAGYESADFCQVEKAYGAVTHVCDLSYIPVEDGRYSLVLCTQVLEHIPEPGKVVAELHRVLAPGGSLWLTAPFMYEEHEEPYDFFRYTRHGLRRVVEDAGFVVRRLDWLEGYWGTLAYHLKRAALFPRLMPKYHGGGIAPWMLIPLLFVLRPAFYLLSVFFSILDRAMPRPAFGHGRNILLVAEKPAHATGMAEPDNAR